MQIPQIEPFQFIRSTAFSERVQLANKVNEIIAGINQIGDIPELESRITELTAKVSELEESIGNTDTSLAELENQVNALISEVNTTVKQSISALESEVDGIDTRLKTAEGTISEHGTEIDGLLKEVIDSVVMTSNPHGTVQVQINHEDGSNDISAPIDLGLVEEGGITLQSGTTDRSFKLIVTLTDGTSWQTNDFVIPEGGGTEVSVTNISIAQGTGTDKIQVKIGLSDGSTISSNDWTVVTPTEFSALGTRVTTAEGNITKNTGDISDLDTRVQALEDSPGYALQPATATTLGGVKIGAGIVVQSDGTISVDKTQINTAAVASTVMFTADASKVTLHADSVAGSEFTEDIPQASQGGAGTIDHASYAKIAANESAISELEADVAALAPSVSVNEEADPPTITVGINGKTSQANLPSGGDEWEEIDLDNFPTDFMDGDIIKVVLSIGFSFVAGNWNTPPSNLSLNAGTSSKRQTVEFMITNVSNNIWKNISLNARNDAIETLNITSVSSPNNWNIKGALIDLEYVVFNGTGYQSITKTIGLNLERDWFYKMYRMRT